MSKSFPMNIPERLGKYPITDVLGKGAMGIVYRGYDPVIRRPVAIKTIRKELIEDDEKAETLSMRFRREAQAAGTLNHPGIVAVYEYGEDPQYAYIAMEYVEGNTLREYLNRGTRFDEHDTVSIMVQLLDALEFAHRATVWHRDIKPANLIVMNNGRVKLTDFGIARLESGERTRTDVIMGTPGYIAPELYLGGAVDQRVDLYSAGVVFYHLLAGQPPFSGRTEAVMHDTCYHDPDAPSAVDPAHRWPQYDEVVQRAMAKSPSQRFQSAAEFRAALLARYDRPVNGTIADSTIITAAVRPIAVESGTPSLARTLPQQATSTPPPSGWSAPVLAGVERELARHLGPVAKVLVRRAAREHAQLEPLVAALVASIDDADGRQAFALAVLGRDRPAAASATTPPAAAPAGGGPALVQEDLEALTRLLTSYIGPIASIVARRAAAAGGGRQDFLNQVAQSLDNEAQRERFLIEADRRRR